MSKIGIVILNYNCSDYLYYTLDSIMRAKTDCEYVIGVLDNGSSCAEAEKAEEITANCINRGYNAFFIRSEINLGFSGGNNVVIKKYTEDKSITHICLLNSDVIVTDYWLDYLTDDKYDVSGPVTNATGNEQTIAVDYEAEFGSDVFDIINSFSEYRHEAFKGYVVETDILYFFNTVFKKEVIESIGYLDERFYPGSFEDGDYCNRIKEAGFHQFVVRDCFVHHFGSGSFSKLNMPDRISISNTNRRRYEEKWNRKWENDSWKILLSCQQDIRFFQTKELDERTLSLIEATITSVETLVKNWAEGIEWLQSDTYIEQKAKELFNDQIYKKTKDNTIDNPSMREIISHQKYIYIEEFAYYGLSENQFTEIDKANGARLLKMAFEKIKLRIYKYLNNYEYERRQKRCYILPGYQYPLEPLYKLPGAQMLVRAVQLLLKKFGLNNHVSSVTLINSNESINDPITDSWQELDYAMNCFKNRVVIHAPLFSKENERDGYYQRIKRIDEEIFSGYLRIYVFEDGQRSESIEINKINEALFYIKYNSHDVLQRKEIFRIAEACGLQYVHSINRFMTDSVNAEMQQLISNPCITTIWDVHGAVPEEYAMYGSELGYKIGNEVEKLFMQNADIIVVVNRATQQHLTEKHGTTKARFVVLPIFNRVAFRCVELMKKQSYSGEKPTVVYSGGVQKWQNVDLMCNIIAQTTDVCNYLIMTPTPEEFNTHWKTDIPQGITVCSKAPEELGEMYKGCDYGFLLRDESVVNRVACPTKILEYIAYGIIPVLKTQKIGDFDEMGLHYLDYQALQQKKLLAAKEHHEYAKANYEIFNKMEEMYFKGYIILRKYVRKQPPAELRIGIVVTTFDKGGLEQIVLNLYKGFKTRGYRTILLCQHNVLGPMAEHIDDGDLFVFNDSESEFFSVIASERISLIHYHYNTFCLGKMEEHNIRTVYTMHNVYAWKSKDEIVDYAIMLKKADAVITVSDFVKDYFNRRTGYICNNTFTIPNGIDFDELNENKTEKVVTRESLGLQKDDITVVFIASFYPTKGQCGMIGVMERIVEKNPKIKLLLVGNIGDQLYYERFKEQLNESPAYNNIIEVPYFDHVYMGAFLRNTVDVFILPTLQEGCSNAVLEAFYCDKPIIMTNIGNANAMAKYESCIVVDPPYDDLTTMTNADIIKTSLKKNMSNQEQLIEAVLKVTDDLDYYKEIARVSDKEKANHSMSNMIESYLSVMEELCC